MWWSIWPNDQMLAWLRMVCEGFHEIGYMLGGFLGVYIVTRIVHPKIDLFPVVKRLCSFHLATAAQGSADVHHPDLPVNNTLRLIRTLKIFGWSISLQVIQTLFSLLLSIWTLHECKWNNKNNIPKNPGMCCEMDRKPESCSESGIGTKNILLDHREHKGSFLGASTFMQEPYLWQCSFKACLLGICLEMRNLPRSQAPMNQVFAACPTLPRKITQKWCPRIFLKHPFNEHEWKRRPNKT